MNTSSSVALATPTLLERVLAYEHPELVERYRDTLGLSPEAAEELFLDVKRYLYLAGTTGARLTPVSTIDKGWHEFLMYTEEYDAFCDEFFGHKIHHHPRPLLKLSAGTKRSVAVELAQNTFGKLSTNWNLVDDSSKGDCSCSCDCDCS